MNSDIAARVIGIIASLTGFLAFILNIIGDSVPGIWKPRLLLFGCISCAIGAMVLVFPHQTKDFLNRIHSTLPSATPWITILIAIMVGFIYVRMYPLKPTISRIDLSTNLGSLFNSWMDYNDSLQSHIRAFGENENLMWIIDAKMQARFSYRVEGKRPPPVNSDHSSGGYMTFYDRPIDKEQFSKFIIQCRATEYQGDPDFGIRLVVDDESDVGNRRQKVIYDLPSVNNYGYKITNKWNTLSIDIGDFIQKRVDAPFAVGINANTINKFVVYISAKTANQCPKATLWFREVAFNK
jgi:hypothetical protein